VKVHERNREREREGRGNAEEEEESVRRKTCSGGESSGERGGGGTVG